ncbi:MAG TPA: polysaccharide deacetylase family protein [Thermoleophilaceae bacterium]|jgi:peptidoglycan/xylan/chitin deacetylase (PgdA/CDA1 family)
MNRALVAGASLAAAWSLPALAPIAPPVARALRVPRRLDRGDAVAITFDDGPHPEGTPAALEALAAANARATFFMVGEQVERDPSLAAAVAAAGHGVAIHGYRHRNQLRLAPADQNDDLLRAEDSIAGATGSWPQLYRPAYGIFSWTGLALVRARGWTPLLWSRWGRDWAARATPESIAALVTRGLTGGDVLLLHDADTYSVDGSHRRTAAALPRVLEEIERAGLETVAL